MYLSHFKLREKPFKISTDPKFLWLGEKHKEALETLRYGILHNDGYVVVTGNVGTGKTTLATALMMGLSDQVVAGTVSCFDVGGLDFLNLIALAYGMSNTFQSKTTFLAHFMSCLRNAVAGRKKVVLIVDEAQRLTPEHLKELLHLSNIEENGTRLLNLIFVGQNEFNDVLLEESNQAVRQRVTINYNLGPLTRDETRDYILHRLKIAQCKKELFTPQAVEETFLVTRGIPRLINTVCDRALLVTYFGKRKKVRPEAVRESVKQLKLPNEKTEFAGKGSELSSESEGKGENEIGQKIRGESRPEIIEKRTRKPPRAKSVYVVAFGVLVVVVGFILFLDREGYLQQYLTSNEWKEKVSRKIPPLPMENQTFQEERSPEVGPFTVEKIAVSEGAGKVAGSSTLTRDVNASKEADVPKAKPVKAAPVRVEENEKSKPKPKAVPLRSSSGQGREAPRGTVSGERSSPGGGKDLNDEKKAELGVLSEKIKETPGFTPGQPAEKISNKSAEVVEPDKVIDWLLERRSDKK